MLDWWAVNVNDGRGKRFKVEGSRLKVKGILW